MVALGHAAHCRLRGRHGTLEPRSADFVAGTALSEPRSADFVAGEALCEPRSADFVAQHFVNLKVQISQHFVLSNAHLSLSDTHTHTHTHSLTYSNHSHSHSHTHTLTHTQSLTLTLTHLLRHGCTYVERLVFKVAVLIEEEEGLTSACCSERNVKEGVKKSACRMATSLVLVALFGFCCLVLFGLCSERERT